MTFTARHAYTCEWVFVSRTVSIRTVGTLTLLIPSTHVRYMCLMLCMGRGNVAYEVLILLKGEEGKYIVI